MQIRKKLTLMVLVVLVGAAAGALALALAPDAGQLITAEASEARADPGVAVKPLSATTSATEGAPDEVSMLVVGTALIGLGAMLRKAA